MESFAFPSKLSDSIALGLVVVVKAPWPAGVYVRF